MHIMYNLYLPVEGKYTKGWGSSAFSGPVQVAENFASMSTSAGAAIIARKPAAEAAEMQKRFNKQVDAQARAAGATPIRVSLPVKGTHFKLQKILALPRRQAVVRSGLQRLENRSIASSGPGYASFQWLRASGSRVL